MLRFYYCMENLIVNILLNEKHSLLAIVKFEEKNYEIRNYKEHHINRRSRDAKVSLKMAI